MNRKLTQALFSVALILIVSRCSDDSSETIGEDVWKKLVDFPNDSRRSGVTFSIGNKIYIGVGRCDDEYTQTDFWSYDIRQNEWKQIADPNIRSYGSLAFELNGKGYFLPMFETMGTGVKNGVQPVTQFFMYDDVTDSWVEKKMYPGVIAGGSVSFVIDNVAYIFVGQNHSNSREKASLFAYDPVTNDWIEKAELPGGPARSDATAFSLGGKAYIIGGVNYLGKFYTEVWQYDPVENNWVQMNDFPGKARNGFFGFSLGSKGYVGGGSNFYIPDGDYSSHEFWRYDSFVDEWQQMDDYPGSGCWRPYATTSGDYAYIMGGLTDKVCFNDFWRFNPEVR